MQSHGGAGPQAVSNGATATALGCAPTCRAPPLPRYTPSQFATSDSDSLPSPPMGDPVVAVPLEALEHFSNPIDMNSPGVYNVLSDITADMPKLFRGGT